MRGEDIIAFQIDRENQITRILVGEVKTHVTYRTSTVKSAHKRLRKAYHPRPMTLSLLAEILYESGEVDLAGEVDRVSYELIRSDFPRDNCIFLINQNQPDEPFDCLEDGSGVVSSLHCFGLSLENLSMFVNDLFDNVSLPR